jgi:DNA-binding CsgD family transcriptional regulator
VGRPTATLESATANASLGKRPAAAGPPAALTSTERAMVDMSLDGAFDQEIGQALFVTTANVRQTLDHVRSRLGIVSAAELRDAVATG